MVRTASLFGQLLEQVPRNEFAKLVATVPGGMVVQPVASSQIQSRSVLPSQPQKPLRLHAIPALSLSDSLQPSRFERVLEAIRGQTYFVDDLSYVELLSIAKTMLRSMWTHSVVREMARAAYPGFQELRQFLKSKDKQIKLSSYEDVDQYDLANVLTLDDFEQRDNLIISHAIPTRNFRRASFLSKVTDEQSRLRLVPEIRNVTLTEIPLKPEDVHTVWHVAREGSMWRFRPDIGDAQAKRQHTQEFAARWRTDEGRLCFTTTTEKLVEMVQRKAVGKGLLDYVAMDIKAPPENTTRSATSPLTKAPSMRASRMRERGSNDT